MPIWIIIAAVASVGVTLLLTSILWRANASAQSTAERKAPTDRVAPIFYGGEGAGPVGREHHNHDHNSDTSGDGGGGDGGGGGE